jgi:drug/metabolite transporter (DMT)-like permease
VAGLLLGPASTLLQFEGLARTTASRAALLMGTLPVLLTVAGVALGHDRLGPRGWAAVALSVVGAALLVGSPGGAGASLLGDALVLGSAAATVTWVLVSHGILARHDPLAATGLMLLVATAWLVPPALWQGGASVPAAGAAAWGAVVALGVVCTALTYALWNVGLRYVSATRAAPLVNLEPLTGAALGVAILGEPLWATTVVGGVLILGAAGLTEGGPEDPSWADPGARSS